MGWRSASLGRRAAARRHDGRRGGAGAGSPLADPCAPVVAVTVAGSVVVSVACAAPSALVLAVGGEIVPAVVANVIGIVGSGLPLASITVAVTVAEPPLKGTLDGFALSRTRAAATVPTEILATPSGVTDPSFQLAAMTAVPEVDPAMKVAVALPCAVGACAG